jgi:hypothetical protein
LFLLFLFILVCLFYFFLRRLSLRNFISFDFELGRDFKNLVHVENVAQCFDEEDPAHDDDKNFICEIHGVGSDNIKANTDINTPQQSNQGNEHKSSLSFGKIFTDRFGETAQGHETKGQYKKQYVG